MEMGDCSQGGGTLAWKETSPLKERRKFIEAYLANEESRERTFRDLCEEAGVSRKTGYTWRNRFLAGYERTDRSRRPHHSPTAVDERLEDAIVAARKQRPRWGPKKLPSVLTARNPQVKLSVSTLALIFKRNGLITPRRRRRSGSLSFRCGS